MKIAKQFFTLFLIVMVTVGSSRLAFPQPATAISKTAQDMLNLVEFQCNNLGLTENQTRILQAIMLTESNGEKHPIGRYTVTSYGLMQVTAGTAKAIVKMYPYETAPFFKNTNPSKKEITKELLNDTIFNITVAALAYKTYSSMVNYNTIRSIAAYNKGPKNMDKRSIKSLEKMDYVMKVKFNLRAVDEFRENRLK